MDTPEIPETATEEYLEKLEEKIFKQLEKTSNKKVRTYLQALLKKVQKRKRQVQQESSESVADVSHTNQKDPLKIFDTAHLTKEEQQKVKKRLKVVLEEIKGHRPKSQQDSFDLPFSSGSQEGDADLSPQTILNTVHLTGQEYEIVKERMKEMLAEVEQQILNISQKSKQKTEQKPQVEADQEEIPPKAEQKSPQENQKETGSISFATVCRRVGKGESLILFDKIALSEREQELVQAFREHLAEMKGLKRQQAFDMQHLTARSIRELEQILKTYHLQGYLRAELNNVYNRLLNLRSRFSILLS